MSNSKSEKKPGTAQINKRKMNLTKSMFQICVKFDDTSTVSRKDPLK